MFTRGIIHCKYCVFTTPIWYTTKKGKRRSGWLKMANHIIDNHPEHNDEAMLLTDGILKEE